jgi:hypothetical protein
VPKDTVNRSIVWLTVPAIVLSLVIGLVAPPRMAAAATSEVVFTATDATFVQQDAPARNNNALTYLVATSSVFRSYLKFSTSSLAGKQITAARLELSVRQIGVKQPGLVVYPSSSSWTAGALTYNTRPPADPRALNVAVLPVAGTVAKIPFTTVSTITTTGSTSFQISYNVPSADFWLWKNGANAPKLVVTVADPAAPGPVTAPAAIVGAGSGPVNPPAASLHRKKVFAHYFTPYPLSLDNKTATLDYYTKNYLSPTGESSKYALSGGLLRDRPLPRPPVVGNWKLEDLKTEVRQASAAGLDGFSVDILNLAGVNWTATVNMLTAAEQANPAFKIMLMPDMSGAVSGYTQAMLAASLAVLAKSPAAYRLSTGELVVAPFKAEAKTPAWWTTFISTMSTTYGIKVAFFPVFVSPRNNIATFASISYGMGDWGTRNPVNILNGPNYAAQAHALGKKWMSAISVQDVRPTQYVYAESDNTEALRASWTRAIADGAEFAQVVTWNDYSELTGFAPSVNHGYSFLDISAYYQSAFQTGSYPAIAREAVFVTHRTQPFAAKPTYNHKLMVWWQGGSAPRNTVEVLTFLNAAATVKVTVGATAVSYSAPAGVFAKLVPLATGKVKATVARGTTTVGIADSPFTVTNTPYVQDLEYFAVSSLRPNTK